jgi:hypothetical protein
MNNTELMTPKIDFVFKLLFGNEKDTSFLISFLNAALDLTGEQAINSVIIMNPVNDRQTKEDKLSIMDVKAQTNDETAINILDFDLLGEETRFHNRFRFLETETHKELTDAGEIHFMELPVLRRYIEQNKEDITKIIGKEKLLDWLLFIDNPDSEYARLAESSDAAIGRAKDMLKTLSADEKLREEYLAREKAIMDHYASLKAAERYGREEGKTDTAIEMLKDGMSIKMIRKYTSLSESLLLELKKEIKNN